MKEKETPRRPDQAREASKKTMHQQYSTAIVPFTIGHALASWLELWGRSS